jgi:hypothetical protein
MTEYPRNNKREGSYYEQLFAAEALKRGLAVSWPVGDYLGFDAIVGEGKTLARIQIKGTKGTKGERPVSYAFHFGRGVHKRGKWAFDFLAGRVEHPDYGCWYIVPKSELTGLGSVKVFPQIPRSKSRWQPFRNAWQILPSPK